MERGKERLCPGTAGLVQRAEPGWFSERSACYLAAGRPVVVQDTGFSSTLPVGEGILPFETLEQAIAAINEVEANYARHAKSARAIAETYFDSEKVLARLIGEALSANGRP
jgi:glycosyltransferase involved in cell wall biosynthesis